MSAVSSENASDSQTDTENNVNILQQIEYILRHLDCRMQWNNNQNDYQNVNNSKMCNNMTFNRSASEYGA